MLSLLELTNSSRHLYQGEALGIDSDRDGLGDNDILRTGSLPQDRAIFRNIALTISLCAEASILAAFAEHSALSVLMVFLGALALAWRYCIEPEAKAPPEQRKKYSKGFIALSATAILVLGTLLIIIRSHYGVLGQAGAAEIGRNDATRISGSGSDLSYVSVILWPQKPQQAKIILPPLQTRSVTVSRLSKPLVIPFEGDYWYFRSPAKRPGRDAHVTKGSPTKVNIHSTDWRPLIMEAHQRLASPIDPRCCRELDLSIRNADNRPGEIKIAVELIDSSSPMGHSEDLGARPVRSSEPPEFSIDRAPVNEVIKYRIPGNPTIRAFNEIEVVFLPSRQRSLGGSQIEIRSFRLIPLQ